MIQTVDFFTPIVDEPYMFGQIAAANSLSDVWAMGGEPAVALNIVGFPNCLDPAILGDILAGGADKVKEAGAVLVGGHSVQDDEPKYGLCVSGFVHPDKIFKNYGCRPGDVLVLTKQIGSGIVNTAIKADMASPEAIREAQKVMASLNKKGKQAVEKYDVSACTDITGFGIAGHAMEMAKGSAKTLVLDTGSLPVLKGVQAYTEMGLIPAGAYRNRAYLERDIESLLSGIWLEDLVYDPQTSGGLLLAVSREDAHELLKKLNTLELPSVMIGEVTEKQEKFLILK